MIATRLSSSRFVSAVNLSCGLGRLNDEFADDEEREREKRSRAVAV